MNNKKLYNKIVKLRKNINIIKYLELEKANEGDLIYGWAFENNDVLNETLEDLKEWYNDNYINDVLNVYYELLLNCQANKLSSKNSYIDNKNLLMNQAISWSNYEKPDISYQELSIIQNYFLKNGKKYGLLKEFKENGIC